MTKQRTFELEDIFRPDTFNQLSNWQQEILSFYSRRLNEYSKLPERLSECREPKDLFAFQTEFFNKLFADYRKEATVISEMMFDMARPVAEKPYDDAQQIFEFDQAVKIIDGAETQSERAGIRKKRQGKAA